MNWQQIELLVSSALAELCNYECPHCQAYINPERYLSVADIHNFVANYLGDEFGGSN
jgi:hypothetical protein